jgi:hypothetical protein
VFERAPSATVRHVRSSCLVRSLKDVDNNDDDDAVEFTPEFTHQIFGEK